MLLLIDDDAFGMKPYVLALEDAGMEVVLAENPDEALRLLEERHEAIELIVLDVMMPTGETLYTSDAEHGLATGRALFKILKERYPRIPIIVLSITAAEEFGADAVEFLQKADTLPRELVSAVERMLALEGGAAS